MRQIDNAKLTRALSNVRHAGASMVVRDTRLIFDPKPCSLDVVIGGTTYSITGDTTVPVASCKIGNGLFRVAVFDPTNNPATGIRHLIYHWQPDMLNDAGWLTPWNDLGQDSAYNSFPGVLESGGFAYVFYHNRNDYRIFRLKFDPQTQTIGENVAIYSLRSNERSSFVGLMPVSLTRFYMNFKDVFDDKSQAATYSQIMTVDTTQDSTVLDTSARQESNLAFLFLERKNQNSSLYAEVDPQYNFACITYQGVDYIFYPEAGSKRTMYIVCSGAFHSDPRPFIPIDVVDEGSYFKLGGASIIDGRICLSGVLSRTYGKSMHIYSFGPDYWSLGRDIYIKGASSEDTKTCPGGRMFDAGNYLY